MNKLPKSDRQWIFWMSLVLCTIYQSYRYPLQINSSGTSPTYSDTPFLLQAGKFALSLPFFLIAAAKCSTKLISFNRPSIIFATVFLSAYSLLKIFEGNEPRYLDAFYWMLFALVLVLALDHRIKISSMNRYLIFLLVYALGSTLVEVLLFLTIGRLPALAYVGTFSIRFGGFLDDPNGFAAILFLLLGWSIARFKGLNRFLVLAGILVALLLTQSWTALAFLGIVLPVYFLMAAARHPLAGILAICFAIIVTLFLVHNPTPAHSDILENMFYTKQGSIQEHSFSWSDWTSNWSEWALLGDSTYNAFESWWAGALINFGIPWLCICLALVVSLIIAVHRALKYANPEARPICTGILFLGYYFAFGSFSLPLPTVFPVNFFFFVLSFLIVFGKMQGIEQSTKPFGAFGIGLVEGG